MSSATTLQLDLGQWAALLMAFLAFLVGVGKLLMNQFERRITDQFQAVQDSLREHVEEERRSLEQIQRLEREFLQWQAKLPLEYVQRGDFVRITAGIETKIDGLGLKIENALLRGLP
jgi:hypothetical protein